jgi:ParB-like chromosome segregation protein Spo0J
MKSKQIAHVKDLKAPAKNARAHTPRNVGMIADAMREVGAARSIVIDENNAVLAGAGTVEGAADAGITKVQIVDADGDTLVAVRRHGLSDEKKRRLALYDNRTSELSEWDADVLRELPAEDLDGLFSDAELSDIIDEPVAERVQPIKIDRPADVAWILIGIPIEEWPKHQQAIESLQDVAMYSATVIRPKAEKKVKRKAGVA